MTDPTSNALVLGGVLVLLAAGGLTRWRGQVALVLAVVACIIGYVLKILVPADVIYLPQWAGLAPESLGLVLAAAYGLLLRRLGGPSLRGPVALVAPLMGAGMGEVAAAATLGACATDGRAAGRLALAAAVALVLGSAALVGFRDSGVIEHLYRPDNMNQAVIDAGWAIDRVTPQGALVVTVEYEQHGSNSPMVLYYAHRHGWSFDATSISQGVAEHLRDRYNACHLVVADWPTFTAWRPDMAAWLATRTPVELPYTLDRYRLFDLGCAAATRSPR